MLELEQATVLQQAAEWLSGACMVSNRLEKAE